MKRKSNAKQKQTQLWNDMRPVLEENPNGIEMQKLCKQLNSFKYPKQFIGQFIDEMHRKYCLIGYLCTNPLTIIRRHASDANKLKKLTNEQYKVYNHIEKSQNEGIIMSKLSQNASIPSTKCRTIINKVLDKAGLISKYTNPRSLQVFYYAKRFKIPSHLNGQRSIFITEKGTIDEIFLNNILETIENTIKTCNQIKGISVLELQKICKPLIKDENGIPLNDIELILRLLLYENKINLIPLSIPNILELNKYITHSKNTYYHLMNSIQKIRNKNNKRKLNELNEKQSTNKRRKLNNTNSIKIGYDTMDNNIENINKNNNIEKYGHIKFRYNNYTYESPFVEIPCQSCPVSSTCSDDGIINPIECHYLNAWLDLF